LIGKSGVFFFFFSRFAEDLLPFFKGFSGVFPGDKFSYRVESEVFQRFFRGFATVFQGFFRIGLWTKPINPAHAEGENAA